MLHAVSGGAIGAGLVCGAIGFGWGFFRASSMGHGFDPGIGSATLLFLAAGQIGLSAGAVVGAFCGIVLAFVRKRSTMEDDRQDRDSPDRADGC